MPMEYLRWTVAEKFGWTLEQVDSLSLQDLRDFLQIQEACKKANRR